MEDMMVEIRGKEYRVREMTLAEKRKIFSPVVDFFKNVIKDVKIKRTPQGGIDFVLPDEGIQISDIKIEEILYSFLDFMPDMLSMSIPDFKEWDTLSESETREPLEKAMQINDFGGFVINFISFMTAPIRLVRR